MTIFDMAKELRELVQLDLDAIRAYEHAIDRIDNTGIRENLARFKNDHRRHVDNLSAVIRALEGESPKDTCIDGLSMEDCSGLRSAIGTEAALTAMRTSEISTNRKYGEASGKDFTPMIKELVAHNYHDEQMHLKYMENALASKLWLK